MGRLTPEAPEVERPPDKVPWLTAQVGAIATITGRIGFRGYTRKDVVAPYEGAISFNPGNIQEGRVSMADLKFISWAKYDESPEIMVAERDILFAKTGFSTGKVALVVSVPWPATINPQLVILRSKSIDPSFFAYLLAFEPIQRQIRGAIGSGAVRSMSQAQIARIELRAPGDSGEQRSIAQALSDADALIESLEQLIEKKGLIKQSAMEDLLTGKRRLPGFEGEWISQMLGALASVEKGKQLPAPFESATGPHAHLNGGMNPSGYSLEANAPGNTIAISEGGNSCGFVQLVREPFWCGGHCYQVRPKIVDNHFLFHALKQKEREIMGLRVGSGLPNVQKSSLTSLQLRLPSNAEEQEAVASVLSAIDAEIDVLEVRQAKARQIKQGMTQELLAGRIRLV